MSGVPFANWGEIDFTKITDREYWSVIDKILDNFNDYPHDSRLKEAPPPKSDETPDSFNDYFYITFKSKGGEVLGLYNRRDQYLFAAKPKKVRGKDVSAPFEMLNGFRFRLPYEDINEVPDLNVTYKSLQGGSTPSYTLADMRNAVTTLPRGFAGNENWGPAMATLIGVTSDAIKSIGMKCHVSFGLNIKSEVPHVPSNRLIRLNNCWDKISKSVRSRDFDFVLKYNNENGVEIREAVTEYSVGLIFAIINWKDGSKAEKFTRKFQKKDQGKRERDGDHESEEENMGEEERRALEKVLNGKKETRLLKAADKNIKDMLVDLLQVTAAKEKHLSSVSETLDGPEERKVGFLTDNEPVKIMEEDEDSEPFPVRMFPCKRHFSDDSSDSSDFYDSDCETIASVDEPLKGMEEDEESEPFPVRMFPCKRHFSDDSSSDSSDFSDTESDCAELLPCPLGHVDRGKASLLDALRSTSVAAKEAGEQCKHPSTLAEDIEYLKQTCNEFGKDEEEREIGEESEIHKEDSLTYRATIPTSSILVKHGTKRPAEVGDKDLKGAKKMALPKSPDDATEQYW